MNMTEDEDLRKLREQKQAEMQLQQQQAQQTQNAQAQQNAAYNAQKDAIMRQLLSSEARARLSNIRLARPQFADAIEVQLIQTYQSGGLRGQTPLEDHTFKQILIQIQQQGQKRESTIKFK